MGMYTSTFEEIENKSGIAVYRNGDYEGDYKGMLVRRLPDHTSIIELKVNTGRLLRTILVHCYSPEEENKKLEEINATVSEGGAIYV